jgi:hypothetical protein
VTSPHINARWRCKSPGLVQGGIGQGRKRKTTTKRPQRPRPSLKLFMPVDTSPWRLLLSCELLRRPLSAYREGKSENDKVNAESHGSAAAEQLAGSVRYLCTPRTLLLPQVKVDVTVERVALPLFNFPLHPLDNSSPWVRTQLISLTELPLTVCACSRILLCPSRCVLFVSLLLISNRSYARR